MPNTVVTSATPVVATPTVPAHCLVVGTINAGRVGAETSPGAPVSRYTYAINWQARLPDAWNSKFHMPGGGGTDGSVPSTTTRLRQGYAAAANDSGHSNAVNSDPLAGGTASFGTDYLARVDFAYNAIDVTTRTAKKLVEMYYDDRPEFSYFEGCSMGGREAMMVTQRLPSHFDGSVSGDPAFRITKVGVWAMYTGQQLAALARTRDLISGFGVPYANNTFTNQDLQLLSKAILDACDALDGVADGMVSNSQACTTRRVKPRLDALAARRTRLPPASPPTKWMPSSTSTPRVHPTRAASRSTRPGCGTLASPAAPARRTATRRPPPTSTWAGGCGTSAYSTPRSCRTSAIPRTAR